MEVYFLIKIHDMKQVLGLLAIVIGLAACQKERIDDTRLSSTSAKEELYGRYLGTFTRNGMSPAQVSILFNSDNTFEGSSDNARYPVICSGTFDLQGGALVVDNNCSAEDAPDPTLLFDGTWSIAFTGEYEVRITKGADEYRLARMQR